MLLYIFYVTLLSFLVRYLWRLLKHKDAVQHMMLFIIVCFFLLATTLCATISDRVGGNERIRDELRRDLASLKTQTTTRGSFFLASGNIHGVDKYTGMVQWEDGWKKLSWNVGNVVIYEITDESTPRVETTLYSRYNKWISPKWSAMDSYEKHKIYIPKDTIIHEFVVN